MLWSPPRSVLKTEARIASLRLWNCSKLEETPSPRSRPLPRGKVHPWLVSPGKGLMTQPPCLIRGHLSFTANEDLSGDCVEVQPAQPYFLCSLPGADPQTLPNKPPVHMSPSESLPGTWLVTLSEFHRRWSVSLALQSLVLNWYPSQHWGERSPT